MLKTIKSTLKLLASKTGLKVIPPQIEKNEAFDSGHYYSVIPSLININNRKAAIFSMNDDLDGIDINYEEQIRTLEEFNSMSLENPFSVNNTIRFNIENDSFSFDDAPILHYMLRKIRPKRIIEIGSGNSSAVMLDANDLYLENSIKDFTFIDIDLSNLRKNLTEKDLNHVTMIEKPIQEVDLCIFHNLEQNDLLFIDSSHVSKIGSDLHTIIFKILPILKPGVYIHFHDIRYPFEYSYNLINQKVFWNEAYLLRAFLMFNDNFKICFWLNCLINKNKNMNTSFDFLPLNEWDRRFNSGNANFAEAGGSIYLKKIK